MCINSNKAIQAIGEHFFNASKKIDPSMSSGTIVIEDKNSNMYKFMQDYVHTVAKLNNGATANPDKPCFLAKGKAYARVSSHFNSYHKYGSQESASKGKPTQYGVDLDTPIKTFTENTVPDDIRSHMLFGQVDPDKGTMFIKFETHGLGGTKEAALHGVNFIRSTVRKLTTPSKDEGASEEASSGYKIRDRRENVPPTILADHKALLKGMEGLSSRQQKQLLSEAKARGVSGIIKQFGELKKTASPEDIKKMDKFIGKIKAPYGKKNLDMRVGNEMIFRARDLQALEVN